MKKRSSKVCKETSDTLTLGTCRDDARAKRAAFHLERCDDCQQDEAIVEAMRESVLSADDQLDDLTRARVGDKLAASIEQAAAKAGASSGEPPLWRRRGAQLVAVAAGVALVVGLLLWQASLRSVEAPLVPRPRAVAKMAAPASKRRSRDCIRIPRRGGCAEAPDRGRVPTRGGMRRIADHIPARFASRLLHAILLRFRHETDSPSCPSRSGRSAAGARADRRAGAPRRRRSRG